MGLIQNILRDNTPGLYYFLRRLKYSRLKQKKHGRIFLDIFQKNRWGDPDSRSGVGSNMEQTAVIRQHIPSLISELGCRTLLDAPCGDFYWMKHVCLDAIERYIGADIVPTVIAENRRQFADRGNLTFIEMDLLKDAIPRVDLIFCRDCLVHFSNSDVMRALRNFKQSGSEYLLTTTFPGRNRNYEIVTGDWRPLNLCKPPFDLPLPLRIIEEQCQFDRGRWKDKSLGLWKLADIPV